MDVTQWMMTGAKTLAELLNVVYVHDSLFTSVTIGSPCAMWDSVCECVCMYVRRKERSKQRSPPAEGSKGSSKHSISNPNS